MKDFNNFFNSIDAQLKASLSQLPPQQRADLNQFYEQSKKLIPNMDDFFKDEIDINQMKQRIEKSKIELDELQKKMMLKYGNSSNK